MDRYDRPEDAIPHEFTVLVMNETDECFGHPPAELFETVRSRLACDRLLLEEHHRTLEELPTYATLVQYPIWIVHHSCLFVERTTQLGSYLRTASYPDETRVLVVLDTDDEHMRAHLTGEVEREYADDVTVVTSATGLIYYLLGHLEVANPCSAAGLEYIVAWNNRISDTVGPR